MAHRSKQNKPCPNRECKFPTLNRQAKIRKSQLDEIAEIDPEIIETIAEANICSSCGCVYFPTRHRQKNIVGFHGDSTQYENTDEYIWWKVQED